MANLVYFTVGNNLAYLRLLDLCVTGLRSQGYEGDILFLTSFEHEIRKAFAVDDRMMFFDVGESDLLGSSANKLKIYRWPEAAGYEKILFCDLDTIWIGSPDVLFDAVVDDKVYMSTEHHQPLLMSHEYWGGSLLSRMERAYIDQNGVKGLNAGLMVFRSGMLGVIEAVDRFYTENIDKVSTCLEQPFVNTYLFRHRLYSTTLDRFVSNIGCSLSPGDAARFHEEGGVLLHFAGWVGDAGYKYRHMVRHADLMLDSRELLVERLPKGLRILEIGVFKGEFSKFVLETAEPSELHLVDVFEGQTCSGDKHGNNIVWTDLAQEYEALKSYFSGNGSVRLHKGYSVPVLEGFEDGYFDMVYIDGDHSYESVRADLEVSYRKVRPGGFICGHDYTPVMFEGVVRAVDEFCAETGLSIRYLTKDGCPSYLIVR